MVFFSALCILFGAAPQLLYAHLPYPVAYEPYTAGKVVFYLQLLLFSGLAFFLLLPLMRRTETISLDTDWLWRVALFRTAVFLHAALARLAEALLDQARRGGQWLEEHGRRLFGSQRTDEGRIHGVFARAWPIGTTALWIAVLLTAYVFFYYLD
jgi:multicomponent Na+:H+ antiporter subunit D